MSTSCCEEGRCRKSCCQHHRIVSRYKIGLLSSCAWEGEGGSVCVHGRVGVVICVYERVREEMCVCMGGWGW